jgi:hypothetical protein
VNFALLQYAFKAPAYIPHPPKSMRSANLLSWSFVCPSANIPSAQVSPTLPRRAPLRMPGTIQTSRSDFVVFLHRIGLLRTPAPGLLHPGTGHGVHCVSAFPDPEFGTNPAPWLCQEASPQRGSYPSTNSPRQQPYRITAAVAPLVVTGLFRLRFPACSRRNLLRATLRPRQPKPLSAAPPSRN